MLKRLLRSILRGSSESLLAVLLVGVFALVFMGIYLVMFPKGSGLANLYGEMFSRGSERRRPADAGLQGDGDGTVGPEAVVATLASISRNVKERAAEAIDWNPASEGMPIHNRQAIQTLARSGAVVSIGGRDEMTLGENTLAVFTHPERESGHATRQTSLLLVGGEVRGRLSSADGAGRRLEVLTASAATSIQPARGTPAQFSVSVGPDQSSTFSLFSGSAEVNAAGKTLQLHSNQAVTVAPSGLAGPVLSLPGTPSPAAPADHAVMAFGGLAPPVEFRWTEVRAADGYRLVLARDKDFQSIVLDKSVPGSRFVHGSLDAGRYFWKVSGLHGKAAGPPGPVRELRLVRDTDPPRITLEIPGEVRDPAGFAVRGRTEPGSRVFIDNESVPVSEAGEFQQPIALKRGVNMIVVEAVDAAGNSAYEAKYVNAKF